MKFIDKIEEYFERRPVLVIFFLTLFVFARHIIGRRVTGWDTFDILTVNFTYMSDALKSGQFPLWNPFVLGGTPLFSGVAFTAALYSPINLFFLVLSLKLNPVWLMEVMLFTGCLLGGIGFFYFLRGEGIKNKIPLIMMPIAYICVVQFPIVGQYYFLYSFAALPWYLYFARLIVNRDCSFQEVVLAGLLLSLIVANGYFFFNFFNCLLAFIFFVFVSFQNFNFKKMLQFSVFGISSVLLFFLLNWEGALHTTALFSRFTGDLHIEEPRIRALGHVAVYFYDRILVSLRALVDDKLGSVFWTYGLAGFFRFGFFYIINLKGLIKNKALIFFSVALVLYGIGFSFHNKLSNFIFNYVPIFNSFRWTFTNVYFAQVGVLITFALASNIKIEFKLRYIILVCAWLSYGFTLRIDHVLSGPAIYQAAEFKDRVISTDIIKNERVLGKSKEFKFDDRNWLKSKLPSSHGYNNSTSPLYWSIKDFPFLSKMYLIPQKFVLFEEPLRSTFKSDNEYLDVLISRIDKNGKKALITIEGPVSIDSWDKDLIQSNPKPKISDFLFSSNKLQFVVESKKMSLVALNNNWHPNWHAKINGHSAKIYKNNYVLQAIFVPPGKSIIELTYRSNSFNLLLIFYFLAFVFIGFNLQVCRKLLIKANPV